MWAEARKQGERASFSSIIFIHYLLENDESSLTLTDDHIFQSVKSGEF